MFQGLEAHPAGIHTRGKLCFVLTSTNSASPTCGSAASGNAAAPLGGFLGCDSKGTQQKAGNDAVSGNSSGKTGMDCCCIHFPKPHGCAQHPRAVNVLIIQGVVTI